MAQSDSLSSDVSLSPITFCYPPRQAYVVHLHRARAVARRRPYWSPSIHVLLCYCFTFLVLLIGTLWLLFSFYATESIHAGKNTSLLYTANSLFVRRIKVTNCLQNDGLVVYGLSTIPQLNKEIDWTEVYGVTILAGGHQEWDFWLNKGSQVSIEYNISDPNQVLQFVVINGEEKMRRWLQDPSIMDMASFWTAAQGLGSIEYEVNTNHKYYFAFGNINSEDVEINVNVSLLSKLHDTTAYETRCTSTTCGVRLDFLGSEVLLLTTKTVQISSRQNLSTTIKLLQQEDYAWDVNVSFEQRWLTYLVFWGAMAFVMLILMIFCKPSSQESEPSRQNNAVSDEVASPVVLEEDEDKEIGIEQTEATSLLSPGSDLDDPETIEDYLCIICFEQRRNCFFDPCGHCATCYSCSMKILKDKKASCPLCRQRVRVVRKLFLR